MTSQNSRSELLRVSGVSIFIASSFLAASINGAFASEQQQTVVAWPEKGLGLSIDLSGFKVDIDQINPDGRRYLMASHPTTGVNVSVTLEKVAGQASTEGCSAHLQRLRNQPPVSKGQDARFVTIAKMPALAYTFREFQGIRLDQRNVRTCLAQENVYADLHLSKVKYTPSDESLFQSVLQTVRFQYADGQNVQAQSAARQSSMQLFRAGSAYYLQSKYDQAIPFYQKAYELEKQQRQLDQTLWRVLVDNLGMAYGMTGRLKEAKTIFEEGIGVDPTYPMFHYNLACAFAELNDMDHAMQSLKTAFSYRKNQNAGEQGMPDPRQDSSFQRFMKNDVFRKLVDSLMAV